VLDFALLALSRTIRRRAFGRVRSRPSLIDENRGETVHA